MTIRFAPQAEADFAAVVGYLAGRNPIAAQEFGERIFALIDKLAAREFDGPEQTLTSGDIGAMARFAAATLDALALARVDVLGWSMGGAVALALALARPSLIRRLVIAGSSPGGVPNQPSVAAKVWEVAGKPVNTAEDFLYLFFPETPDGQAAGRAHLARLGRRGEPTIAPVKAASVNAQVAAIQALRERDALFPQLRDVRHPLLFANGMHDVMVPAYASFAAAQGAPHAQLILYPASGHGFLFHYAAQFAGDVTRFLSA